MVVPGVFVALIVAGTPQPHHHGPPREFILLFGAHLFTMVWAIGLMVIYIVNVFRNERVDKDKKVLWTLVLLFGGMIAMPVYWYLYIWREPTANRAG